MYCRLVGAETKGVGNFVLAAAYVFASLSMGPDLTVRRRVDFLPEI